MNCQNCKVELTEKNSDEGNKYCRICDIVVSHKFPGVCGTSDGPGSGTNQFHFSQPKPYEETVRLLKTMEDHGKLTPKAEAIGRKRLERLEKHRGQKVDYQKTGFTL